VTPTSSLAALVHEHASVHQSFTIIGDASRDVEITAANQPRRFSQKSGFGERR